MCVGSEVWVHEGESVGTWGVVAHSLHEDEQGTEL